MNLSEKIMLIITSSGFTYGKSADIITKVGHLWRKGRPDRSVCKSKPGGFWICQIVPSWESTGETRARAAW